MNSITLILPYYRAPRMLREQLDVAARYPAELQVIVVDDGSPEPAADVWQPGDRAQLYRICEDIPWNRGGARNLGVSVAQTEWVLNVDIDHVLPWQCADALIYAPLNPRKWYRFPRWRNGRADSTRRKDPLPETARFGPIRPHIDSHLMTRERFLGSPYDERYSGCLGGGSPFLDRMTLLHGAPEMMPDEVRLHVYTRDVVVDASVSTLSRDTTEYARRRAKIGRHAAPTKPLNFTWERAL